uniref:Uncharacterized protein n=1 Tax=Aegilops tauschii subsp. strangulata TaxID=200361 RepID=A0A453LDE0_AEGTS
RPMEISTNVRPPRLREVIQVPKKGCKGSKIRTCIWNC